MMLARPAFHSLISQPTDSATRSFACTASGTFIPSKAIVVWALLVCTLALTGCGTPKPSTKIASDGRKLDSVVLMLNWYPEAEHGGFYAAKVHGLFEKYGLDVDIRAGGPSSPVAQELLTGRVQFAVGNADDVLLFRQEDADIVALLAPIQDTPRCIMVHESSPVKDLHGLAGLTLQANVGRPFLNFLEFRGLLKDVKVVPFSGSVSNFVADKNMAIQAYSFSEPLLAKQQGAASRSLMVSDVGFNPYASCLIATRDYIGKNRELSGRMVAACREGWLKYFQSPQETNELILKLNSQGMTADALEFGTQTLKPLCFPSGMTEQQFGQMTKQRWQDLCQQFVDIKLGQPAAMQAEKAFDDSFLKASE